MCEASFIVIFPRLIKIWKQLSKTFWAFVECEDNDDCGFDKKCVDGYCKGSIKITKRYCLYIPSCTIIICYTTVID